MKFYPVEADSDEWRALRLGRPTASGFKNIITPARGDKSGGQKDYAAKLVGERLLKTALPETFGEQLFVARGKQLEPDAAKLYAMETGLRPLPGGFITNDAGTVGCSLDRLIEGHKGGLEIKCHNDKDHILFAAYGPEAEHKPQVQAQLWIAELDWVDLYFYHPLLPSARFRIVRDEAYIEKMAEHTRAFLATMDEIESKIRERGFADDALVLA